MNAGDTNMPSQRRFRQLDLPFGGKTRKGVPNRTTPTKTREVARLAVRGLNRKQIAEELNLHPVTVAGLFDRAKQSGDLDQLSGLRDERVTEFVRKRREIAQHALDIIERRVKDINTKDPNDLSARDMNDAFKALDHTEHTGSVKQQVTTGDTNVVVFSPDVLKRANQALNTVYDVDGRVADEDN